MGQKNQGLVEMSNQNEAAEIVDNYTQNPPFIDGVRVNLTFSQHQNLQLRYENQNRDRRRQPKSGQPPSPVLMMRCDGIDRDTGLGDVMDIIGQCQDQSLVDGVFKVLCLGKSKIAFVQFHSRRECIAVEGALSQRHVYLNGKICNFEFSTRSNLDGGDVVVLKPPPMDRPHERPPPMDLPPPRERRQDFGHRDRDRRAYDSTRDVAPTFRRERDHAPDTRTQLPPDVIRDAEDVGIPLHWLTMMPAVKTENGPVLFEEYYQSWKENSGGSRAPPMGGREQSHGGGAREDDYRRHEHGRIVMIQGLNEEKRDCHLLQNLCGALGNVSKVKLSFKNKDTGFVEMCRSSDAARVIDTYRGIKLHGNTLKFILSSMTELKGIPDKPSDTGEILTRSYIGTERNRYRDAHMRKNIHMPGKILHVSNLNRKWSDDDPEAALQELSELCGGKETCFVPGTSRMQAFINAGSPEDSIQILVDVHMQPFHGRTIRISYANRNRMPDLNQSDK